MKRIFVITLSVAIMGLSGCWSAAPQQVPVITPVAETPRAALTVQPEIPPGTVQFVWEEPMVEVIDVPAGLDAEGHYYRPAHQQVIEVRQGRWRIQRLKNRPDYK